MSSIVFVLVYWVTCFLKLLPRTRALFRKGNRKNVLNGCFHLQRGRTLNPQCRTLNPQCIYLMIVTNAGGTVPDTLIHSCVPRIWQYAGNPVPVWWCPFPWLQAASAEPVMYLTSALLLDVYIVSRIPVLQFIQTILHSYILNINL